MQAGHQRYSTTEAGAGLDMTTLLMAEPGRPSATHGARLQVAERDLEQDVLYSKARRRNDCACMTACAVSTHCV